MVRAEPGLIGSYAESMVHRHERRRVIVVALPSEGPLTAEKGTEEILTPFSVRLWRKIEVNSPHECWPWQASTNGAGYGLIRRGSAKEGRVLAHRAVFEEKVRKLREDEIVRHKCDNPACCNPSHLEPGTKSDNAKDAVSRGRHARAGHGGLSLSVEQVITITELYKQGISQAALARQFKVSKGTIHAVVHGKTWREKMAKYNTGHVGVAGSGPLQAEQSPSGKTHEGGTGYQRDIRSELFLRATCNFAGEDKFYEKAATADARARELVQQLAVTDDGWVWVQEFLPWLRKDGNIRSASVMLAAEAVKARLDKGLHGEGNRALIGDVLQRADEPGEMLAYWMNRYGRAIPKPVKRGVADRVKFLYTERNFLRYDKREAAIRFGDVLELVHAKPFPVAGAKLLPHDDENGEADSLDIQGVLFQWAITARHNRDEEPPAELKAVSARRELSRLSSAERAAFVRSAQDKFLADGTWVPANPEAKTKFRLALAGQWEWGRSWLQEGD